MNHAALILAASSDTASGVGIPIALAAGPPRASAPAVAAAGLQAPDGSREHRGAVEPEALRELDELRARVAQLERDVALLREEIRHPAPEMQP